MSSLRRVCVAEAARVGGVTAACCGGVVLSQINSVSPHSCYTRLGHTARRSVSSTGGGKDDVSFVQRLKDMYQEFQLSQDRRLDALAAEEAQEGRDRFFSDAATSGGARRSPCASSSSHRGGSPELTCNPDLCPRSVLFVPGSKPRAMAKIPTLAADCFILDLEDSVGVGSKRQARENIRDFVEGLRQRTSGGEAADAPVKEGDSTGSPSVARPRLIVRINSPDFDPATAMLDLELVGLLGPALEGIAIPKTTPRTYSLIKDYVHPDHQLWAFFESPKSVTEAPTICRQRVYQYAVMGYNDLSVELQLPMTSASTTATTTAAEVRESEAMHVISHLPLWQCTTQVLLAARAHNMFVIDAVFNDPTDKAGFQRSLRECRALGLNGKTLIHPGQIEATNAAYTPAAADVAWAARIVEAMERAQGGVATVDGKMVEELHARQASRVLALHRSAEAEKEQKERVAAAAAGDGTGDAGTDGEAGESAREPRRTPSRHRPLS